jgi:hypothetical protein
MPRGALRKSADTFYEFASEYSGAVDSANSGTFCSTFLNAFLIARIGRIKRGFGILNIIVSKKEGRLRGPLDLHCRQCSVAGSHAVPESNVSAASAMACFFMPAIFCASASDTLSRTA